MIAADELYAEWEQARARATSAPVRQWLLRRGLTEQDLQAAELVGGIGVAHVMPDGGSGSHRSIRAIRNRRAWCMPR
jgi:hypothetical protein